MPFPEAEGDEPLIFDRDTSLAVKKEKHHANQERSSWRN